MPKRSRARARSAPGARLRNASRDGDVDAIATRLAAGAGVDMANKQGETALILASRRGYATIVRVLLAAGADPDVEDTRGRTALMEASQRGHTAVVETLLAAGANIEHENDLDESVLECACIGGAVDILPMLLAAGADATFMDEMIDDDDATWADNILEFAANPVEIIDKIEAIIKDAKGIRARHLLGRWRAATRLWRLTNWWWRVAGEGQHAPGMPGATRARAEFEALNEYNAYRYAAHRARDPRVSRGHTASRWRISSMRSENDVCLEDECVRYSPRVPT